MKYCCEEFERAILYYAIYKYESKQNKNIHYVVWCCINKENDMPLQLNYCPFCGKKLE